jgi:hypothetical protein
VGEFSRSGGPVPRPIGGDLQHEHEAELRENAEREHTAEQAAARDHRPWWKFWARRST